MSLMRSSKLQQTNSACVHICVYTQRGRGDFSEPSREVLLTVTSPSLFCFVFVFVSPLWVRRLHLTNFLAENLK